MNQPSKDHSTSKAKTNWLSDLIARVLILATSWLFIAVAGITLMVIGLTRPYRSGLLPDGPVTADGLLVSGVLLLIGAGIIRALRKE